jgi:hypothetical protein
MAQGRRIAEGIYVDVEKLRVIEGLATHEGVPPGVPIPDPRPFVPIVRIFSDDASPEEIHVPAGDAVLEREKAVELAHSRAEVIIAEAIKQGAPLKRLGRGLAVRPQAVERVDGVATHRPGSSQWLPIARMRLRGGPEIHLEAGDEHAGQAAAQELARAKAEEVITALEA